MVSIESIMPPKFTDYLLRVINSNRFSNERFRYRYILENPVTKKGMYEILRQQLSRTNTERFPCFQTIQLTDTFQGNVELDMECNDLFFWACKDTAAKFVYTFPDGREETLVIGILKEKSPHPQWLRDGATDYAATSGFPTKL